MSILSDLKNRLFKTETIPATSAHTTHTLKRYSLGDRTNRLGYDTGMEVMQDTTVSMCYDVLKYLLSSKQWVLVANENDDQGVYDFVNDMLFNMETELNEVVKRMIEAMLWGFHVEEMIFDVNEDGRLIWTNTVPVAIQTLQNDPFTYNTDGELISIHQEYDNKESDIPINKCLKYTFGDFTSDYGHGILLDVKDLVEYKFNTTNWLLTFLERHSLPSLVGKTDNPMSRDEMLDAFADMQDGTLGMTVGLEDEVTVLESNHHGETFFNTFSYLDNQIVKRFYIGDLIMGTTSSVGSYARTNSQLDFSQLVYDGLLEEVANCIQRQAINRIVEFNFGNIDLAPTFSFDKFKSGDIQALFEVVKPLIDSGVVDSENGAVQDSIAMLFKKETGLSYVNDEPVMPDENFDYTEPTEDLTTTIIDDLDTVITDIDTNDITGQTD